MPSSPQRPFIPKRTPPESRGSPPESEFRVAPPFVHGRVRSSAPSTFTPEQPKPVASIADFLAAEEPVRSHDFLAPTEPAETQEFVATKQEAWPEPPSITDFVAPEAAFDYTATVAVNEAAEDTYDLPPIEHFTDPIADEPTPVAHPLDLPSEDPFPDLGFPSVADEHGWEETDWQRYDWRSAAALGEAGDPAANTAWAQTDWDNPGSGRRARESAAQAIADALDGIARRIREGDLVMPQPPAAVPDPATIAATLAALLGVRR